MKLLTIRSVGYLEKLGHDFCKETLLLSVFKYMFWHFEDHRLSAV